MFSFSNVLLMILLFTACVPQKSVVYLQDKNANKYIDYERVVHKDNVLIEPFDELYIEIVSLDREDVNFFERRSSNSFGSSSPEGFSIISYRVDESGNVNLPVIGRVKVSGYTLVEATDLLEKRLVGYLNQPSIKLKFVNKSVTMIGYVRSPGRYYYSGDRITIFQALGMAGDIVEYGNRKSVLLIREDKDGVKKTRIDLTNESVLESPYYYLRSNDVIYVEPLRKRWWGMNSFPFSLVLSSITTFILVLNYTNN
jgi:polysaccharide export outer membrane protein